MTRQTIQAVSEIRTSTPPTSSVSSKRTPVEEVTKDPPQETKKEENMATKNKTVEAAVDQNPMPVPAPVPKPATTTRSGSPLLSEDGSDFNPYHQSPGSSIPMGYLGEGYAELERYDSPTPTVHSDHSIKVTVPPEDEHKNTSTNFRPAYVEEASDEHTIQPQSQEGHAPDLGKNSGTETDGGNPLNYTEDAHTSRGAETSDIETQFLYPDISVAGTPEGQNHYDKGKRLKGEQGILHHIIKFGEMANKRFSDSPDVLIAVMGKTGTGKTSFINAAIGDPKGLIVGHGLQACTQEIQTAEVKISGRNVVFIDTPGFDDTDRSDVDILNLIATYLQTSISANVRLSGIIYLHSITDARMQGSTMRNVRMFRSLCGDKNLHNVILCTTGWHQVDQEVGKTREAELMAKGSFWGDMKDKGARVERHFADNAQASHKSATRIAQMLVGMNKIVLQIQEEMVHLGLSETSAGKLVKEEIEKLETRHKEEIEVLKKEFKQAQLSNNKDDMAEMKKEYENQMESLKAAHKELEKLMKADQQQMRESIARLEDELSKKGGKCTIC